LRLSEGLVNAPLEPEHLGKCIDSATRKMATVRGHIRHTIVPFTQGRFSALKAMRVTLAISDYRSHRELIVQHGALNGTLGAARIANSDSLDLPPWKWPAR
jgi:hypothetical protein